MPLVRCYRGMPKVWGISQQDLSPHTFLGPQPSCPEQHQAMSGGDHHRLGRLRTAHLSATHGLDPLGWGLPQQTNKATPSHLPFANVAALPGLRQAGTKLQGQHDSVGSECMTKRSCTGDAFKSSGAEQQGAGRTPSISSE